RAGASGRARSGDALARRALGPRLLDAGSAGRAAHELARGKLRGRGLLGGCGLRVGHAALRIGARCLRTRVVAIEDPVAIAVARHAAVDTRARDARTAIAG